MRFSKTFIRSVIYLFVFTNLLAKGSDNNDTIKRIVNSRAHFLNIGTSTGWFSVRDYATSPLIYKGFLPGAQIGFSLEGRKINTALVFNFSYGKQATRNYPENDENTAAAYNNYLSLAVTRKLPVGTRTNTNLLVGGNLGLIANFRNNSKFNNANFNWEGFGTIGPLIMLERKMKSSSGRIMKVSASFSVPVIAAVSRPLYTTIGDFVDGVSPTFSMKDLKYASFPTFFSLDSHISASYFLQNGNGFLFSYHWYYYDYHPNTNMVKGVAGVVSLSFMFRLNKK
jgi:hypothetical protein